MTDETELAELRAENARLRARVAQLEADELMRGQAALAYWGAPNPALDVPAALDARQFGYQVMDEDTRERLPGGKLHVGLGQMGSAELLNRYGIETVYDDPPEPRNNDHEQDGA